MMDLQETLNQERRPEMTAHDVVDIVHLLNQHDIDVWVDGGWGVDALLGEQTRRHMDLDVAIRHTDVLKLRAVLEARGYTDMPRDDTRDCNFVLGDTHGHQVDVHTFLFDAQGTYLYGCEYPLESLTGSGAIQGHPVKCISPEWMVAFHTGYPLDADDYHDVRALCHRFRIQIPDEYHVFMAGEGE